ncbi:MAG: peptidase [Gemmatimonadetes bacterium]|nr:peptidase [Gemmatimonadota bacterium]
MLMRKVRLSIPGILVAALGAVPLLAQTRVTTPEQFFGHRIGADYVLPNYTQYAAFIQKLDAESDRIKVVDMGKTAEGRSQYMAIITSPANHENLERYRQISERLAKAEGLSDGEARQLAAEGKAVVWIDGGLHANEVLGAQQLTETIHQLVSRNDAETLRILDDVIILAVHANPDGMELVSNWYMREPNPTQRSTAGLPRLYQKYIGHDNNRDFFASTQAETENMNRQMYHVWFPQIIYNHHQTGPAGTVMFAPPFRDPFNYVFDPLVITQLDLVGAAMHSRFEAEGKPGVTMRSGANYSTWWNGGLRTMTYFHNMIGLLTETIGNPTPVQIPLVPAMQLPRGDLPFPIAPQEWRFRQSIDYSLTANYAVLDVAERYKDAFLYNIYLMGRNAIRKGSQDTWTTYPKEVEALRAAMPAGGAAGAEQSRRVYAMLRTPENRDPRAYILPANQPDFPTAVKFVNALREAGVTVHRATAPFTAGGKAYPAGSLIVKTAQAFRAHVLDMFEPQDHPNDFEYPGGPPVRPYDATGWTLAFQMGVDFDRILDAFDAPTTAVNEWNMKPPAGRVATAARTTGFLLPPKFVDSFGAAFKLMSQGEQVYRLRSAFTNGGKVYEPGTYYIPAAAATRARVQQLATELGVSFDAATTRPAGAQMKLAAPRIALWDQYGGSMPSGWTRWIMEQHGLPFEVVYAPQLDAGNLRAKYDVIVFVGGAIPAVTQTGGGGGATPANVPPEFQDRMGRVSADRTVPQLRAFMDAGGSVVAIGSSTSLAAHLALPLANKLLDASGSPLPGTEYYIPGSLIRARVDNTLPVAYGVGEYVDVFFDNSPVFTLTGPADAAAVQQVAWFDSATPMRSGWAWGEKHLQNGVAMAQARVGAGTLYLFGPEILFRAQPHGTFKFFFNALAHSAATDAPIR